jgi:flagellar basal-body rod modification protein FlgD
MSNPLYTQTGSEKTSGASSKQATKGTNGDMTQQDFLNLMMTQLKNQDPLDPMKDTDFMAQMASFNSLNQLTTLNKNMTTFMQQQGYQNAASAATLLGMQVTGANGTTGVVSGITVDPNGVSLTVGNNKIPLGNILSVAFPSSSNKSNG